MNELTAFETQNKQLDDAFDKVLAGALDVGIVQAAASVMNAKTRRYEIELKRAVKGQFLPDLVPRWKREHTAPTVSA